MAGVLFVCGLTPYNDFVMNNTYLVGNFLPIGLMLFFIVFVMAVNAPLLRWLPRFAFSRGELAVALAMTLVSCGLPSSGLMRYLPAHMVGFTYQSAANSDYRSLLTALDLPAWLFPTTESDLPVSGSSEPVISNYYSRTPDGAGTFLTRLRAVPWVAWAAPALAWGALLACFYGAILCLCALVHRQWAQNERLAFPLASIYTELIEQPSPGRCFNALLRNRTFWISASIVFAIHGINALAVYQPTYFPTIPIRYDLRSLFADGAWKNAVDSFKAATLFFCVVGIVYFLQSSVAFSFVASYLLLQVFLRMVYGAYGQDITEGMTVDFTFGALIPFAAMIVWVGRGHWFLIAKQMWRGQRDGEPAGQHLSYRIAGWGLILCLAGMVTWLSAIGVTIVGALVLVLMLMTILLVISRIVAETGLIFVQLPVPLGRPWILMGGAAGEGLGLRTTLKSYFFTSWFHTLFSHDLRETPAVYTSHALRITDHGDEHEHRRARRGAVVACLAIALVIGYLTAGASMLYCEYSYASTLDAAQDSPINQYGVTASARSTLQAAADYRPPHSGPKEGHSRWTLSGLGFSVTAVLAWLRLRFVGWPFHPLGSLLAFSYPMQRIWFSILVGWIAKVMIVRFGGASLYRSTRPAFIGLIIGETAAAAFWLVVSLVLLALDERYHAIRLLPS